jgi:signal transduction histidine kinase/ActR/RegA family two-component response regulator
MGAELDLYPDISQRAFIFERVRQHGQLHGHEQAFRSKTGAIRHSVMWANVLTIGEDPCVLVVSLDVTEQTQAAAQQKELEEQLRQAQKLEALGTLAGGIAHDFNNILGAIISYSELTKMDNADNLGVQQYQDEVLRASQRATTLVRQILSFSRHQKEVRQELQLGPIIREALSLLRATLPSTIALQRKIDGALPNVLANPTQVHQIVMNLCTNAAHAMRGQQGKLSVELDQLMVQASTKPHVELEPGPYVRLSISDTGEGMDLATQQRIFEPFFTTKGAGEGTGLGLSVVHGIVKEYQGVVTVDSVLGRGTRLCIYLPARPAIELQAPAALPNIPRGAGQRILFVDDEPALGDVAQKMMDRLGYRAVVFQSSEAALAAFRNDPGGYDALVTDLTMPEMTGIELARQVLALRPGLPIVLASGSSGSLTATEVRQMGIRELVSKPVDYETLARILAQVLQRGGSERPAANMSV